MMSDFEISDLLISDLLISDSRMYDADMDLLGKYMTAEKGGRVVSRRTYRLPDLPAKNLGYRMSDFEISDLLISDADV